MQRLVIDCRGVNYLCRAAPTSALATPGAFATVDWSEETLRASQKEGCAAADLHFGAIDLVDSFYQLRWEFFAESFALNVEMTASEAGTTDVWDSAQGRRVDLAPSDKVFPCLAVLPMGWSWSLWFCHLVLCNTMVNAEMKRRSVSRDEAATQLLLDRQVAPRVEKGKQILASCGLRRQR